ncbi:MULTISPECIES: TIGR04013 family B12-binding domain/radical SAM domain-containing protein [Thermodesulfovibrio]|jgi:B12-binding domain/radical SAM domain protein|uniref:TIGR04013 family B12-binding domain/radical SAM domain-containing protein n=1 Tax=Thermodesulfovibrio TaxID=28261 RepID=UPI002613F2E1|nr:TIGR04013 family B12-binding domain/radical SAM domain-containing protein [Thermodesulfovibrio sp.]
MKLFFFETKFNRYSITPIVASLEQRNDLNVDIVFFSQKDIETLEALMKDCDEGVFCFSFCSPQWKEIKSIYTFLREKYPASIFIAGGPAPSGVPRKVVDLGFDYVFVGEAEKTFPELLSTGFRNLDRKRKSLIKGERIDLNDFMAWSTINKRFSPLEITRGCPFACKFCQTSYLFGTKPRHRSIESIQSHAEIFLRHGMRDFRFITPNAMSYGSYDGKTLKLDAVEQMLKSLRELSDRLRLFFGTFPSEIRPEHLTKEAIQTIKPYIFNRNFTIGAQSGSDRMLDRMHRGHSTEDVYRAVKNAIEEGFSVDVDFIFGLPEETSDDQKKTIKFMELLVNLGRSKNLPVRIHSHYFIPLKGTPYGNYEPSGISKELTTFLGKLYNSGRIFGHWHKQKIYTSEITAKVKA